MTDLVDTAGAHAGAPVPDDGCQYAAALAREVVELADVVGVLVECQKSQHEQIGFLLDTSGCPPPARRIRPPGLDWDGLTALLSALYAAWEAAEVAGIPSHVAAGFDAVASAIVDLREFTGWGGVPGEYLTEQAAGSR